MSKSRPFRILALPLVRIPHGPLRVSPRAAIAAGNASNVGATSASSGSTSASSAGPASAASASASSSSSVATETVSIPPSSSAPGAVVPSATETPLILYHVQQPELQEAEGKPPIYQRALNKAADEWAKMGTKPRDSWMFWFHEKGEGLMDKIDYEEWSLKAIHEGRGVKIAKEGETQQKIEIPLLRPSNPSLGLPALLPKLHRSLLHKIPHHRKMMYRFLIFSPITWPFAIIPVVPNFPLFYVLWRAWSHYKAWRGATYLESLLKLGMIVEKPSKALDEIYAHPTHSQAPPGSENTAPDATRAPHQSDVKVQQGGEPGPGDGKEASASSLPPQAKGETAGAADSTSTPASQVFKPSVAAAAQAKEASTPLPPPTPRYPGLLLTKGQLPALQREFDLHPSEKTDIARAIEQADMRAKSAEKVLFLQAEGKKEN